MTPSLLHSALRRILMNGPRDQVKSLTMLTTCLEHSMVVETNYVSRPIQYCEFGLSLKNTLCVNIIPQCLLVLTGPTELSCFKTVILNHISHTKPLSAGVTEAQVDCVHCNQIFIYNIGRHLFLFAVFRSVCVECTNTILKGFEFCLEGSCSTVNNINMLFSKHFQCTSVYHSMPHFFIYSG